MDVPKMTIKITLDQIAAILREKSAFIACLPEATVTIQLDERDLDCDRDDYATMFDIINDELEAG